jgi:hypothetical protein
MKPNTKFIFTVMFQNYSCAAQFQDIGYLSDSEGRSNKTIIFTTYKQRHCVGVSPKVLQIRNKSELVIVHFNYFWNFRVFSG